MEESSLSKRPCEWTSDQCVAFFEDETDDCTTRTNKKSKAFHDCCATYQRDVRKKITDAVMDVFETFRLMGRMNGMDACDGCIDGCVG